MFVIDFWTENKVEFIFMVGVLVSVGIHCEKGKSNQQQNDVHKFQTE